MNPRFRAILIVFSAQSFFGCQSNQENCIVLRHEQIEVFDPFTGSEIIYTLDRYKVTGLKTWGQLSEFVPDRILQKPCSAHFRIGEIELDGYVTEIVGFSEGSSYFGEIETFYFVENLDSIEEVGGDAIKKFNNNSKPVIRISANAVANDAENSWDYNFNSIFYLTLKNSFKKRKKISIKGALYMSGDQFRVFGVSGSFVDIQHILLYE